MLRIAAFEGSPSSQKITHGNDDRMIKKHPKSVKINKRFSTRADMLLMQSVPLWQNSIWRDICRTVINAAYRSVFSHVKKHFKSRDWEWRIVGCVFRVIGNCSSYTGTLHLMGSIRRLCNYYCTRNSEGNTHTLTSIITHHNLLNNKRTSLYHLWHVASCGTILSV